MTARPKVAALVAAYNAERTIRDAIDPLLAATDCQVYVVDDCSRIPVGGYLQNTDGRITVIRLEKNAGPAAARNAALTEILAAGFDYVAIADADDISAPDRIAKQAAFMEANPKVGACGTWVRNFQDGVPDATYIKRRPGDPRAVRDLMFFNIGVSHASAMIRCEAFRRVGLYSQDYPAAEDYDLLCRIGKAYDVANIEECLLDYRLSPGGQSMSRRRRQLYDRLRIQLKYFEAGAWRAWAGVARTLAILLMPAGLFDMLRSNLRARSSGNSID
ncbi:MAG: glycosyltransferase [Afipia felis]|nr:glycosyltransferase [Afipia felis]